MFNKVISILSCLILFVLAGCRNAVSSYAEEPSAENRTITLNLDITTRAEGDTEVPDNFYLWIFKGDILLKCINSNPAWTDIYNGTIDLQAQVETEIDVSVLNEIQFYLLLNTTISDPLNMTPQELKTLTFVLPDTPYSDDNKVPMSGEAKLEITADELQYDVEIKAVRSVAKMDIYCTKGSETSSLIINDIELSKVPNKGYLFDIPVDDRLIDNYTDTETLSLLATNIDVYYTGTMPGFSDNSFYGDETNFIKLSHSYLLENLNGDEDDKGFIQVDGTVTDDRYCITLNYTLNDATFIKRIYVSKVKRNQYSKIYIRINDTTNITVYCQVNSWVDHKMDVPAFQ